MSPGPARAQVELPDAIRCGSRVVKSFGREHDPQLAEEPIQHRTAVSQAGKLHTVTIDILNHGTLRGHDQFSQGPHIVHFTSKELNQPVRVINRALINDHTVDYIRENNPRRPHV